MSSCILHHVIPSEVEGSRSNFVATPTPLPSSSGNSISHLRLLILDLSQFLSFFIGVEHYTIQSIQNSPFFSGLSKEACIQLAKVAERRELPKRDILFTEGIKGNSVFLLTAGRVQLQKTAPDGSEIIIRTIKEGEIFAEVILFESDRYPVTAIALIPSTILSFKKKDILALLDHEDFRNDFIASLMRKQRYLAQRLQYLTSYDVEQRFFIFLDEQYGKASSITIDLSKKDIAGAIGATPETFSRLTTRLKKEGLIEWNGKVIEVPTETWDRAEL